MPRFNPALLPPAPEVKETRTFEGPDFPEPLTLTMRFTAGFAGAQYVGDAEDRLFALWGPDGKPILPGGEAHPIPVSRTLCWRIAVLMLGDKPESGGSFRSLQEAGALEIEEPWKFEDWAMLSHRAGDTFNEVFLWARGLLDRALGPSKNASTATGENSSGPPTTADNPTPTS